MEIDKLKRRLQAHFTDGLMLVVGSGLSCADGMPSMADLANVLIENVDQRLTGDVLSEWHGIIPLIQEKGLEPALTVKPPSETLEAAIAYITANLISARESEIIEGILQGIKTLRLTKLIPHLLTPTTGLPIVTTNYDRLVEIAVEEADLGVDTLFTGKFSGRLNERESKLSHCRDVKIKGKTPSLVYKNRAIIYKPHGSLDWYLRNDIPIHCPYHLPDVTRLIITPGGNKFRSGYDSPFDQHRSFANNAIDKAVRYLIIGYGFNDDHLETHLSPAIRNGKPTLLITENLSRKARKFADEYSNVISLERSTERLITGTTVTIDRKSYTYRDINIWDLNSFIAEVLES